MLRESNAVNTVETQEDNVIEFPKAKPRRVYKIGTRGDKRITKVLEAFLNGDTKRQRFGNYFIDGDQLLYRAAVSERGAVHLRENVIAQKFMQRGEQIIIGNSSMLNLIGRRVAFGHEVTRRGGQAEVQQRLSLLVPMLPFSVFEQAELDLTKLRIIHQAADESITRKYDTGKRDKKTDMPIMAEETVHFTGASLFKVEEQMFLFDLDRREIEHKIFNPFLVKLPDGCKARTVEEAYEALKPQAVKDAEKAGLEVKRQGEWFFIEVTGETARKLKAIEVKHPRHVKRLTLSAGQNRPNYARGIQLYKGESVEDESEMRGGWTAREKRDAASEFYCKGKVEHSGREHAALLLKQWYRAIPNTATESFTITGDID
jgi:hypothetical protein